MEDDLQKNGRRPQQKWKMTSTKNERRPTKMEDDLKKNGRRPQKKMKDNLKKMKNGRQPQVQLKKATLIGSDIIVY